MQITDVLNMFRNYEESVSTTGYRDEQIQRNYMTVQDPDREDCFLALSENGNVFRSDKMTLKIEEERLGYSGYESLEGKELRRYSPVSLLRYGTLSWAAPKTSSEVSDILRRARERITEAETESRKHFGGTAERILPAFTGDERIFRFFSKSGFEVRLFTPGEFRRYNEARRYYMIGRLPYPEEKSDMFLTVSMLEKDIKARERTLESSMQALKSELKKYMPETDEIRLIVLPQAQ